MTKLSPSSFIGKTPISRSYKVRLAIIGWNLTVLSRSHHVSYPPNKTKIPKRQTFSSQLQCLQLYSCHNYNYCKHRIAPTAAKFQFWSSKTQQRRHKLVQYHQVNNYKGDQIQHAEQNWLTYICKSVSAKWQSLIHNLMNYHSSFSKQKENKFNIAS